MAHILYSLTLKEKMGMVSNQKDSPFVLVEHGNDGFWHVHEWRFDTPGVLFHERQEACDYAAERARGRKNSMVLLRSHQNPVESTRDPAALNVMSRWFGWAKS